MTPPGEDRHQKGEVIVFPSVQKPRPDGDGYIRKSSLIRVADNRQVALSRSFGSLVPDYTLEECVTRRREDYWYLPDLQDFAREARQRLEVNNPLSFFEFSWRGYDPGYTNWERIVNRYRLVSDDNGTLYEVSTNIGCEPLTSPPPVFD